jgi:hypothetical protein
MAIMEDFEEGDRICLENMDGLKVGEGHYDFGRAKQRGFKHRKYVAEPYVGTVGWFQFNKGAKKTVHSKDGTTTFGQGDGRELVRERVRVPGAHESEQGHGPRRQR